jgi:hypothetical protein
LPWNLHASSVPSLLFIPAASSSNKSMDTIVETIFYKNTDSIEIENLVEFIVFNAQNPLTLLSFLEQNIISLDNKQQKVKLNIQFSEVISNKLVNLERQVKLLNSKLTSLHNDLNRTLSWQHSPHDFIEKYFHETNDAPSDLVSENSELYYTTSLLNNFKKYLSSQLNTYSTQINILKEYEKYLKN